ncbi:16S rRNA (guanine(966)-N(2))-methyltransferase RsmD [Thalassotalea ponticola]|uniref:16S rRNA (guanine(966)-N(2))-methyltransferase RsmD n=1 Tax=Thalassotalea ponticola TaxID=1523392 RepID=UPI0025B5F9B7|nr:16S rRNA (guanine(966)-N(2))-methyltransferase RsmD [Thalassotalea ponticola]MDN3652463.1 16S rRNA (guanine(966)-N(2))-methyltransferase RsmD [Thalassotalea ponticola]
MAKKPQQSRNKPATGQVRIIAGVHRGRKLAVLNSEGLRPTTDRVKETVFNWLMLDIRDAVCLDCFSGSGSLGFEALSRGAQFVDFIEKDTSAARQLQVNVQQLNADNAKVSQGDCLKVIESLDKKYDVVFIDPPFRKGLVNQAIVSLNDNGRLNDNALVYVEVESEQANLNVPTHWQLLKQKQAGQVAFQLYRVNPVSV